MKYKQPQFSKSKTDFAGKFLSENNCSEDEKNSALMVLSNWRAAHSYPMHIFKKRLKKISEKLDKNAVSSQRLKRAQSIIKKLNRKYKGKKATMKLTQMQDIAGCRTVMSNVELVRKLYKNYYPTKGDLRHIRKNKKDYITYPKEDGYRSIHLIYKYKSDKEKKKIYNDLLIEVQIRTKIQHIWATAVETTGFFIKQGLKFNEGEKEWADFFRLVSSAFAKLENCPLVPNTPLDERELFLQIKEKEKKLNVINRMRKWTKSLKLLENLKHKKNTHLFLLELDTIQEKLVITSYSKRQEEKAIKDYSESEKRIYGKEEYDVVLVGADTFSDLKHTYPNYFLDTREFIKVLKIIINKNTQ